MQLTFQLMGRFFTIELAVSNQEEPKAIKKFEDELQLDCILGLFINSKEVQVNQQEICIIRMVSVELQLPFCFSLSITKGSKSVYFVLLDQKHSVCEEQYD